MVLLSDNIKGLGETEKISILEGLQYLEVAGKASSPVEDYNSQLNIVSAKDANWLAMQFILNMMVDVVVNEPTIAMTAVRNGDKGELKLTVASYAYSYIDHTLQGRPDASKLTEFLSNRIETAGFNQLTNESGLDMVKPTASNSYCVYYTDMRILRPFLQSVGTLRSLRFRLNDGGMGGIMLQPSKTDTIETLWYQATLLFTYLVTGTSKGRETKRSNSQILQGILDLTSTDKKSEAYRRHLKKAILEAEKLDV